ncbi:MAG: hypothetical protein CSB13_02765 [Chloroflexi bacterium]|nr:MAG: hypothetical protein CSB13_02765 [Chloroflexota bacterium]
MKHWYVIYTKPKSEYRVAAWLAQYEIETYVPGFYSLSSSSQTATKEILFPCYMFAKISLEEEGLSSIQWVPGVRRIVSFGGQPVTIPDCMMEEMRQNIQLANESRHENLEPSMQPGTLVRVVSGPFQGMQAIFERPTSSRERVQVLLDFLGRVNRVKLDIDDLEVVSKEKSSYSSRTAHKRPRRTRGRGRRIKVSE